MNNLYQKVNSANPAATWLLFLAAVLTGTGLQAQTFPVPGLSLPNGKTVVITYEVDVNAEACPAGSLANDLSNQSTVSGSNFTTVLTDDPDNPAANPSPTLTPLAGLTLGNLVYRDNNKNGVFDAGDTGIDGVLVRLYLDDGDGTLDAGDGAALATATTAGGGLYSFSPICSGDYLVEIAASNFDPGGPLYDNALMAALVSSPVGGAPDPDNDVNNDDNGDPVTAFGVAAGAVTLTAASEPVNDGDADANTNLTVDFGFKTPTTVTITDVIQAEGTGGSTTAYTFTITRSDNLGTFDLTVNTAAGTAVSPSDYTAIVNQITSFTAGGPLTNNIVVAVNHDNMVEANETFTLVLSDAPAAVVLTDATGLGTITNDDAATVTLTAAASQPEGNAGPTFYVFTATLNNPVQGGFTVPYTLNPGTATFVDLDFAGPNSSLTFAGTAGETETISVQINGDLKVELDETFSVSLGAPSAAGVTAGPPVTGTITNDDSAVVSLAGNVSQGENLTPQVFTVNLSNPVDVAVTVLFNTSNGSATTADNDYTGVTNQTVTFPAGTTTAQSVNVTIINDNKVENNEAYNVALSGLNASGRNVTLGTSSGTGTIVNDDAAVVTLSGGGAANEGNTGTTPRVFTATLNNPVQGGFTVPYTTNDGTATTADLDYVDNDATLTFAGTAGEAQMITVLVNGDFKVEANETFTVVLGAVAGAPAGVTTAGSPQTGTITNDEVDYGDAPDPTYPTLLASNGARHTAVLGLSLGAAIDGEADGQPNASASGDGADEDGVTLPGVLVTGVTSNITVNASAAGLLNAWIDYNNNGSWADAGEQVFTNTALVAGNNNLAIAVPSGATPALTFGRFRFSTASGLSFTGSAADGEVEDYQVNIATNQFSVNNPSVPEGNSGTTALSFTVTRTDNSTTSTVDYAITAGTATAGTDFVLPGGGTLTFPMGGALSQTVSVTVNGDMVVEDNETIILTLSNPVNGGLGANPGTGTITNDDNATLTLSGGMSQNETNAGTVTHTFTATLSSAVQGGFTIAYTTNNGTATAGSDYTDNDGTLTFAGTVGETKTFTVQANGDITVELDETFTGNLGAIGATSGVQAAAITVGGSPQTATIVNDDSAVLTLAGSVSQAENLTPQVFTVNLSNPVDVAVTVLFNTSNGTATTADNDYTGITNQTVTFAAGTTTAQTVNVAIINDNKVEANEVYNVALSSLNASGRNVSLGASSGTGTITNDDAAVVTLTSTGGPQNEGNTGTSGYQFNVTLNNPVQGGFTLVYNTNDGTATVANNDYQDNDGTITFAGTAGENHSIIVQIVGDFAVEPNETFTVTLGSITGAPAGVTATGSPQTGTITNDEVDFGDAPATYGSADHDAALNLFLGAAIDGDPANQPSASADGDDTDAEGDDEDGVTLPSVLVTGTTASVTVNASASGELDGWIDYNGNGVFTDAGENVFDDTPVVAGNNALSIAVPAGATVGVSFARFRLTSSGVVQPTGHATSGEVEDYQVSLVDNQFSINSPSVLEGNSGTTSLTFTISRTTNAAASSVDYAVTGGTATAGTDYAALAGGTINFPAGGALSQTVSVTINGDIVVEDNETIIITLSNPVNGGISGGTGTGTIANDDNATLTLTGGASLTETNAGTVAHTFTATLSAAVQGGFTVAYTTNNGTATAGSDYNDNDGTLTFAGTAGETQTITVLANGDITVELNETFSENLGAIGSTSAVQAAAISVGGSPQTGTIVNDDSAVVSIAGNVSQAEALTPQVFTVTLSNPVDVAVTVLFSTSDGTAMTSDNDYNGFANQMVTFAANTTTAQSVNVTIINDSKVENNEVYNVALSGLNASGRNVSVGTASGTGTIVNDDSAVVTLSGGQSLDEGNSGTTPFVFTVTLSAAIQGGVTVNYSTNDGTATIANFDYQDNDGALTFAGTAGESHTFTVLVNGDFIVEANETFQAAINSMVFPGGVPAGSVNVAGSPQTATILNDEVDYGDAPDPTYPTLLASNGARHNAVFGFRLGAAIDGDPNGQPTATANGDDTDAEGDDEDGVTLPNPLVTNTTANVTVNASAAGRLDGWVDFNNNGSWADAGEKVFNNVAVVAGNNTLTFAVPNGATPSTTMARFRFSSAGGLSFDGAASDGEVEDYQVQIVNTQFFISDATVTEGNAGTSNLTFTITRSTNASNASVNYAITGGTATTADNDYQPLPAGTVSFTAGGALTQTVTVLVNGDVKVELNETVEMTLSSPVNATIVDGTGIGTIVNDDAAVLTITNPSMAEGDVGGTNLLTFTITMSNPSDANVSVNYATLDGTATTANSDYVPTSGTHTFTPGQVSKTVSVTITGDCVIEPNETLLLRLSGLVNNGRNVSLSGGGATLDGTGTITNDDALPVMTCPANLTVNAALGTCSATVTVPLPTTSSLCGGFGLQFRYRTVDALGNPTGPYNNYAPSTSNVVTFGVGRYQIEWQVSDGSGTVTCTFFLRVQDTQPPSVVCRNAIVGLNSQGTATIQPSLVFQSGSDNCGVVNLVSVTPNTFTCANLGLNSVTLVVNDGNGNTASCVAQVNVKDLVPPQALCKNIIVYLDDTGHASITPSQVNNGTNDACGLATLTINNSMFDCGQIAVPPNYTTQQLVVLTAKDVNGNQSSCNAYVSVRDNIAPTAVCEDVTVTLNSMGKVAVQTGPLTDGSFDNCGVYLPYNNPYVKLYSCSNLGDNFLTIAVKDYSTNASTCVSTVTVLPPPGGCTQSMVWGGDDEVEVYTDALEMTVYPNPASEMTLVAFGLVSDQPVRLRVFDIGGRLMVEQQADAWAGENVLPVRVAHWPAGVYVIDLQSGDQRTQKRLVIQRD